MIPANKVLNLADFADSDLVATLRRMFPHEVRRFGPAWPARTEYRKEWEVGMAVLALERCGALHQDAHILGVGAGNEPTLFYLTNHVRTVHATDLYLVAPPPEPPRTMARRLRSLARAAIDVARPAPLESRTWAESANLNMFLDPGRYWPLPWNRRRLVVQHMNGLDLQYEDATFDAIFSSGSIEHFGGYSDVHTAAREMARVLKPGGVLTLSTEHRLAGPPPGLPGILMFTPSELFEHIVVPSGLEPIDEFDYSCPGIVETADEFDSAADHVRRHVAEHGELIFHKLAWPRYPAVALRHGDRIWTSCHLALRKPATSIGG
jgi:SAM-dependent methyltransferase